MDRYITTILISTFLLAVFYSTTIAAVRIPSSCSQSDVQDAIDLADPFDTIAIPSGDCTGVNAWSGTITIDNDLPLIIKGAGSGNTIIESSQTFAFDLWKAAGDIRGARVTQIKFVDCKIKIDGENWRVDNCIFDGYNGGACGGTGVLAYGYRSSGTPKGLVDNCDFYYGSVVAYGSANIVHNWEFARDLDLGTDEAVYVEDCTFNSAGCGALNHCVDANTGGRYVLRHSVTTGAYIEAHSIQEDAGNRGAKKWEIYNNTINASSDPTYSPFRLRGGTGVIYNNIIGSGWTTNRIELDNVRSHNGRATPGVCNGYSSWDGNNSVSATYFGDDGDGTVTSADTDGKVLTDSGAAWVEDSLHQNFHESVYATGEHTDDGESWCDGADGTNDDTLCNKAYSFSAQSIESITGMLLVNTTDGSACVITGGDTNQIECTLTGGSENDWDENDSYRIVHGATVTNVSDNSVGWVIDNDGTTITHSKLSGGDNNDWEIGDTYKISYGYPCRDQIGRSKDDPAWVVDAAFAQSLDPAYEWNNCQAADPECVPGDSNDIDFGILSTAAGDAVHIRSGRDFIEDEEKPNYTPYTYPHPLRRLVMIKSGTPATITTGTTVNVQ